MAKLNVAFQPNTKIQIKESKATEDFRTSVTYDGSILDAEVKSNRADAEQSALKMLKSLGVVDEDLERIAIALDVDAQLKYVKRIKCNTTLNVFLG